MSKTLIHFPKDRIAPKGGPSGYLYNLSCGLNEIGAEGFDFLPPVGSSYEQSKVLQRLVPGRLKDFRRLRNLLMLPDRSLPAPVDYAIAFTSIRPKICIFIEMHSRNIKEQLF